MMKKTLLFTALLPALLLSAAGEKDCFRPKVPVKKVENFNFDTGIDHPAWKNCQSYELLKLIGNKNDFHHRVTETGFVKYLYDRNYFYILADFIDSDIIQHGKVSGGHLYKEGDLLEIFIKPGKGNYYWEIYGTPNRLNTRFYFTSKGTIGVPSGFKHIDTGIKVKTKLRGTLNDQSDRDQGYQLLIAIPIAELNRPHTSKDDLGKTVLFEPGEDWRVQSARYNYSRYLTSYELSSFPQTVGGYHNLKYFAEIELLK